MTSVPRLSRRHPCWFSNSCISLSTKHWHLHFLHCWRNVKNYYYAKFHVDPGIFSNKNRRGLNRPILRPLWLMTSAAAKNYQSNRSFHRHLRIGIDSGINLYPHMPMIDVSWINRKGSMPRYSLHQYGKNSHAMFIFHICNNWCMITASMVHSCITDTLYEEDTTGPFY